MPNKITCGGFCFDEKSFEVKGRTLKLKNGAAQGQDLDQILLNI